MDIFIVKNSQKAGPYPVIEVISMLESGAIAPDVKGWHKGCESWMPLKSLPALDDYFNPKVEKSDSQESIDGSSDSASAPDMQDAAQNDSNPQVVLQVAVPNPWLRFSARMFDIILFTCLYFVVLRYSFQGFQDWFIMPTPEHTLLYICVPFVIIESLLLSTWGTTPGKAIMGIRVRTFLGQKLNFLKALKRSAWVMVLGTGCFISLFPLVALFLSWWSVRRVGMATWDMKLGVSPMISTKTSSIRYVVLFLSLLLLTNAMDVVLEPWVPQIQVMINEMLSSK